MTAPGKPSLAVMPKLKLSPENERLRLMESRALAFGKECSKTMDPELRADFDRSETYNSILLDAFSRGLLSEQPNKDRS